MKLLTFICVLFFILPFVYANGDPEDRRNHPGAYGSECVNIYRPLRWGRSVSDDKHGIPVNAKKPWQGTCGDGLCCHKRLSKHKCGNCKVNKSFKKHPEKSSESIFVKN